jgi:hypothetical protein
VSSDVHGEYLVIRVSKNMKKEWIYEQHPKHHRSNDTGGKSGSLYGSQSLDDNAC